MKITVKLPGGGTLEFEGDESEFTRVTAFLENPPESLTAEPPAGTGLIPDVDDPDVPERPAALTPAAVVERFDQIEPQNDQERVTIIAQLAMESGEEGVTYETLEGLYRELGLPMPAQFPTKTLSNAKGSGLVLPVRRGLWRPTHRGANFARGFGRQERHARRPRAGSRPTGSNNREGGDSD